MMTEIIWFPCFNSKVHVLVMVCLKFINCEHFTRTLDDLQHVQTGKIMFTDSFSRMFYLTVGIMRHYCLKG